MTSEPKWFDIDSIEMDKEEVEEEVLEAVKEAKEKKTLPDQMERPRFQKFLNPNPKRNDLQLTPIRSGGCES